MSQRCLSYLKDFSLLRSLSLSFTHKHTLYIQRGSSPRPELHISISFKLTLNTMLTAATTKKMQVTYQVKEKMTFFFLLLRLIQVCRYRKLKGELAREGRGRSYRLTCAFARESSLLAD